MYLTKELTRKGSLPPPAKSLLIKRGENNIGSFSICEVPDSAQAQTEEKTSSKWEKKKRWGELIDKIKFRGAGAKIMLLKQAIWFHSIYPDFYLTHRFT